MPEISEYPRFANVSRMTMYIRLAYVIAFTVLILILCYQSRRKETDNG